MGSAKETAAVNFPYRPVAGFASGDRYVAMAVAGNTSNRLVRFRGATGGNMTLVLPNPWPANSLTVSAQAHPTVSGLSYADPNLKAYRLELWDSTLIWWESTLIYQVAVSKEWLGSATSYTVPDLSSQLTYTPFASGATVNVNITAILSPAPILNLVSSGLSLVGGVILDSSGLASFTASTDISLAIASGQYQVGGAGISLPR